MVRYITVFYGVAVPNGVGTYDAVFDTVLYNTVCLQPGYRVTVK